MLTVRRTLAAAAMLALAGCGSTVAATDRRVAGNPEPSLSSPEITAGAGGPVADQSATSPEQSAIPQEQIGPSGTGPVPSAAAALPPSGRGYDAKNIYIGFPTQTDVDMAAKNVGLGVLSYGDQVGQIRAVIDDVNRHGGVLGRTLSPVFHDIKTADASTFDRQASGAASAVLRFRSNNVTHVLSSDSFVAFFMLPAEDQGYRPRYGLNSYHVPAAALQALVPPRQLAGSLGIGWLPVSDVDAAHNPGPVGPGETACRKVMKDAGVNISSAGAALIAMEFCDGTRLFVDGIVAGGGPGSRAIHAGVARAGPTFRSALVWRSGLSSSRFDLPGMARDLGFDGSAYRCLSAAGYPL